MPAILKRRCNLFLSGIAGFLLYLPLTAQAFDMFDCIGSEPNWKLSIDEQEFTFKLQDQSVLRMSTVNPSAAENMNIDHIRVFRTKLNGNKAIIIIQKQSCTAGDSEDGFAYEGLFITDTKVYHGCCSKKIMLTNQSLPSKKD